MPYKDAAVRRERRRDYMRDFMRRKRAAEKGGSAAGGGQGANAGSVSSTDPVSSRRNVSTPPVSTHQDVSARVSSPARGHRNVPHRSAMGITPAVRARAAKVWRLTALPTESQAGKDAARLTFAAIALQAGVTEEALLAAIGQG